MLDKIVELNPNNPLGGSSSLRECQRSFGGHSGNVAHVQSNDIRHPHQRSWFWCNACAYCTLGFVYFHTFSQMGGLRESQRVFGGKGLLELLLASLNANEFGADNGRILTPYAGSKKHA